MEYPKRLTATNDVTGALLKSRAPSDSYSKGWDAVFGKKEEAPEWIPENLVEQGFKDDGYTQEDYLEWLSEQGR